MKRFVRANDETGLWEVRQGNCLLAAFDGESLACELAASPMLLDACRHVMAALEREYTDPEAWKVNVLDLADELADVITKAEGRSN